MKKLDQLVKASEQLRKINARFVRVVAYKTGRDKKGLAVAMAKTYTRHEVNVHRKLQNAKDQNRYVSHVKFMDKKLNVEVSCSCPDFLFRWEYRLAEVGAAKIRYSNGEAPTVNDMGLGMCKHLLALRELIKKKHNI
jgi:hypothetical protein